MQEKAYRLLEFCVPQDLNPTHTWQGAVFWLLLESLGIGALWGAASLGCREWNVDRRRQAEARAEARRSTEWARSVQ